MIPSDVLTVTRKAVESLRRTEANFEQIDRAQYWIDTMPIAPEPDWSQAPDEAVAWAVDDDGEAKWWFEIPIVSNGIWYIANVVMPLDKEYCQADKIVELPIGIDYRTTLRRRPEAENKTHNDD